jgi:hypothetical protein
VTLIPPSMFSTANPTYSPGFFGTVKRLQMFAMARALVQHRNYIDVEARS